MRRVVIYFYHSRTALFRDFFVLLFSREESDLNLT
tara:strand:- start:800 stop:904 length:105 start_codon:yes stop_codon:yes gene_type:complete